MPQAKQQPVIQINVIESQPEKQAEALSLMTERARFMSLNIVQSRAE